MLRIVIRKLIVREMARVILIPLRFLSLYIITISSACKFLFFLSLTFIVRILIKIKIF